MTQSPEEQLDLSSKNTPYRLRLEFAPGESVYDNEEVVFVDDLGSLEEAQHIYMEARDASDFGASRFYPGEIFDASGDHVARISYNGRLWKPEPLGDSNDPISEAPKMRDMEDRRFKSFDDLMSLVVQDMPNP